LNPEQKQALKELKDDFKEQIEYIEQAEQGISLELNLDWLIRDNSDIRHDNIMYARRNPCQILQEWLDEIENLQEWGIEN
jgi:hypothetical protein